MTELTQEQKLALRLRQIISEPGFHELMFYVAPDGRLFWWLVKTNKVEGENVVK